MLEQVVAIMVKNKDRWVDLMMKEKLEMIVDYRYKFKIEVGHLNFFFTSQSNSTFSLFARLFDSRQFRSLFVDNLVFCF